MVAIRQVCMLIPVSWKYWQESLNFSIGKYGISVLALYSLVLQITAIQIAVQSESQPSNYCMCFYFMAVHHAKSYTVKMALTKNFFPATNLKGIYFITGKIFFAKSTNKKVKSTNHFYSAASNQIARCLKLLVTLLLPAKQQEQIILQLHY